MRLVLDSISFSVAAAELVSLIGPSGCGKSTLLRLIAGLDFPDAGKLLVFDEPLGALDAFTRMRMQDEVLRLWENRRTTMLLVTHDIDEAIYMSDRILIITPAPGRIDRKIDIELMRPRDRTSESFLR